jgi:catechol 2,3-dioxygenase-like lactoylglutathione lyase family enzyme
MQKLKHITLVVKDYDEAIDFFTRKIGFELLEDSKIDDQKRWVLVGPAGSTGCSILLAKASGQTQSAAVGNQTGGRVGFFLNTDDFWADYRRLTHKGVRFVREPKEEPYGTVAVFEDLYGNLWDLIQSKEQENRR